MNWATRVQHKDGLECEVQYLSNSLCATDRLNVLYGGLFFAVWNLHTQSASLKIDQITELQSLKSNQIIALQSLKEKQIIEL